MSNHKRKIKLIHKPFQLKMIGIFLAISCFAALVQMVMLAQSLLSIAHSIPAAGEQIRAQIPGMLGVDLAWTVLFLVPFMLLVGMNVTHKVAGPTYSIDRYLNKLVENGTPERPCSVRAGDELQGLVKAINAAVERLEKDRKNPVQAAA